MGRGNRVRDMGEREKRADIAEVVRALERLSPIQVDVVRAIIERFADDQVSELVQDDFLDRKAFEYFSMRLAAHHASSSVVFSIILRIRTRRDAPGMSGDLKSHIGARVKQARKAKKLTQAEVADRLGKAVETISNIERGASWTSLEMLENLSMLLDERVAVFFEGYVRRSGNRRPGFSWRRNSRRSCATWMRTSCAWFVIWQDRCEDQPGDLSRSLWALR